MYRNVYMEGCAVTTKAVKLNLKHLQYIGAFLKFLIFFESFLLFFEGILVILVLIKKDAQTKEISEFFFSLDALDFIFYRTRFFFCINFLIKNNKKKIIFLIVPDYDIRYQIHCKILLMLMNWIIL